VSSDSDIDWAPVRRPGTISSAPRGQTFALAREALSSRVHRETLSVYEATAERLGHFDIVLSGSVLIHLRDPVRALERIAGVCRGQFVAVEGYHRWLGRLPFALAQYRGLRDGAPVFWEPNIRGWERMMQSAGFSTVEEKGRFTMRSRAGWKVPHVVLHCRL